MTLNPSNPQRGTGVRKAGTGVRPAVPAPAPAPAARPATGRRPGAPALGGAARPPLRSSSAAPKQGGKGTKYLMLTIIVLLLGMVAYACIPIGGKPPLIIRLARMYGLIKKPSAGGDAPAEESPAVGLDARYGAAIKIRERAQSFLADQEQKYKDAPQSLTDVDVKHVLDELEKYRNEVYLGVDDIGRVVAANGKDTAISADVAKEEQKKQKTAAMDLGKALQKWKGPKEQIFSKSDDFVANKFNPTPAPDPKPAQKRDPKSLLTVVAPATPNDIPKPPDAAKEDAKPGDPKPEPEKPKEDAKPEPEKPKPVESKPEPEKPKSAEPKPAEPKPDSEKPKEDAKPEPEKPKPTEPKPEPEKPKEDPRPAEPKPEPEKPKEAPKAKVDAVLSEGDKLVLEGSPMAKDVIGAARNLPSDPDKLKTL
ncbi:MAG TPA: hypothetical protein VKU80_14240, partial [Planctomycetota bacterium]|nr:hypothetical protein [Planctomycetota bacterium]